MNHYTYEIKFENNMKYIGVRSCKCPIEEDSYLGSSKIIPAELYKTCTKTILSTFPTRVEAIQHEIDLHNMYDVCKNPEYYNQAKQTHVLFNQQGAKAATHPGVQARVDKITGRTKTDYEYLAKKGKVASSYRGSERTEAQKAADLQLSSTKGIPNLAKGNSGMDNPQVKPWYYITPDGIYTEVHTSIRAYLPTHPVFKDWCATKIYERISTKPHIPSVRGIVKGYTFGYLHNKPTYLTQENICTALQISQHIDIGNVHKETYPSRKNLISNITGKK